MGRPPEKARHRLPKNGISDPGGQIMLNALGAAGWALAAELVVVLVQRGMLTDKQGRKIVRGAIDSVIGTSLHPSSPSMPRTTCWRASSASGNGKEDLTGELTSASGFRKQPQTCCAA